MSIDVLGMGAVAMDLVLRCADLPGEDGFSFVREEKWLPGGSCSNVLVTLASLGAASAVVARIGDDAYGIGIRDDLERAGISTRYLFTKAGGTSLHTLVAVADRGARSIFANLGDAFLDLPESLVTQEMLEGVKVFYTDLFTAKAALKAAALCREKDIPVVFNLEASPAFMESCGVTRDELEEMIGLCHILCLGREGLRGLTPHADDRRAAVYLDETYAPPGGVVATFGEQGAFWTGGGQHVSVPACDVEAVDTTGAGDAFAGGLIYARLLKKRDVAPSLAFANACGAIKCTQPGPRISTDEGRVEAFMEARKR